MNNRNVELCRRCSAPSRDNNNRIRGNLRLLSNNALSFVSFVSLFCLGERILACGTNAFSPRCSWRPVEAIDVVSEWSSGVAR